MHGPQPHGQRGLRAGGLLLRLRQRDALPQDLHRAVFQRDVPEEVHLRRADEGGHPLIGRAVVDRGGRAVLHDHPVVQHEDARGEG